jgi:hypothetical protein
MAHECFADETAIDFLSVGRVVERMRDAFLGERIDDDLVVAEVSVSKREACLGHVVPIELPIRVTCRRCGGRGETWTEPCHQCSGTGESPSVHVMRVSVPPGIAHGSCLRFRVTPTDSPSIRVEVRVAVRSTV